MKLNFDKLDVIDRTLEVSEASKRTLTSILQVDDNENSFFGKFKNLIDPNKVRDLDMPVLQYQQTQSTSEDIGKLATEIERDLGLNNYIKETDRQRMININALNSTLSQIKEVIQESNLLAQSLQTPETGMKNGGQENSSNISTMSDSSSIDSKIKALRKDLTSGNKNKPK